MREIKSEQITDVIRDLCIEANCHLPQDIRDAMAECRRRESFAIAENILEKLEENDRLADADTVPICKGLYPPCSGGGGTESVSAYRRRRGNRRYL